MILESESGVRITMAAVRKKDSLLQLSRNAAWNGDSVDICRKMSTAVPMNAWTKFRMTKGQSWEQLKYTSKENETLANHHPVEVSFKSSHHGEPASLHFILGLFF